VAWNAGAAGTFIYVWNYTQAVSQYRYDPQSRRYEPYVVGFIRVAGLAILGSLAVTLAVFWRREVKRGTIR
jgi:hypothetical protein